MASCSPRSISPDLEQVRLLPGIYRIPELARPLLRAALLDHQARGLPAYALFTEGRGSGLLLHQAMGNLVGHAAALADLPIPLAGTRDGRRDYGPEEPFSAAVFSGGAVQIDGAGSSPTSATARAEPAARNDARPTSTANLSAHSTATEASLHSTQPTSTRHLHRQTNVERL